MDKLWYSVAVSVLTVGCGGDVDSGSPVATGGTTAAHYGVLVGGTSATGGASTGGISAVGGASSAIDLRYCEADSDCTQCLYIAAPSNSSECPDARGCCGGQVMNKETCNWNQSSWKFYCSDKDYPIQECPCVSPCIGTEPCRPTCKSGKCGYW